MMDATRTTVAHTVSVANGMPLAAISARPKVPPLCVTVIGACASCKVAGLANTVSNADGAVVGLRRCNLYGNTQRNALSVTM